ncbi:MAG: ABC transporter substrate-binding protein [Archaeoglobaceae archaeon]
MRVALLIFLILASFLCGCSEKLVESGEILRISDMSGKELEIKKAPERVIFLSGESWIYALGIKEKVVAVSDNAKLNPILLELDPEISKIPSVGDMNRVNEEAILFLKPDVIVVWDEPPGYKENAKKLEKLGIPIFRMGYIDKYPEDVCKQAKLLGKIFEVENRAEELCNIIEKKWSDIISKKQEKKTKVLYSFTSPIYIACKNNYAVFIEAAGGEVVYPEHCNSAWIQVSKEWIIEANPEIWIINYYARYNESAILGDPAFSDVEAVKKKAVFKESFLPMQFLEPYFLLTVQQYKSWITGDVDLEKEKKILLKEIYGVKL